MAEGDDMVTSESKASDRAKEFANSGLPALIIASLTSHTDGFALSLTVADTTRSKVIVALLEVLEVMCITDILCEMLEQAGAIAAAHRLLELDGAAGSERFEAGIVKATCSFLAAVARRDDNKDIVAGIYLFHWIV